MARRANLRASDSDRELVAERLRQAAAEGRLLAEELEARLTRALRARTYAELDPLVADLPVIRPKRELSLARIGGLALAAVVAVAVVGMVVALAVVVLTGFAFAWGFWIVLAWFFCGRRCRPGRWYYHRSHYRRPAQFRYAHRRTLL